MKRALSFPLHPESALLVAGTCLVATTYGLVRLAYGLFLPDISASLDLDAATAGRISSGASLVYCLGALGGLVGAGHPRRLVVGATATASVGSLGAALAPDVAVFAAATVLASAGAGLASPGLVAVVERHVAPARQPRAQAVVNSGTGPGLVAAGVLALVLLPSWRLGFVVSAVLTLAAGAAVLLLDVAASEAGTAPTEPRSSAAPPSEKRSPGRSWGWWRGLLLPATASLLLGASSAVVWTYGRSQLVAAGAGVVGSTVAWTAVGLGGTLTVLTARATGRLAPARAWSSATGSVALATAAWGLAPHQLGITVVAAAVFGWGFVAATSALIAWSAGLAPGDSAPGTAVLFVVLVLGQAVGASAAGVVAADHGLPPAFLLAAVVASLGAACGLARVDSTTTGNRPGPAPDEEESPVISRHVSVVVRRTPAEVYDLAADPDNLARWAHGLADSEVEREGDTLVVASPLGRVRIAFVARNALGVLDHDVTLPTGEVVTNPMRVMAHPDGAEVLFTVRQLDLDDDELERDAATVQADLERLRDLLEA